MSRRRADRAIASFRAAPAKRVIPNVDSLGERSRELHLPLDWAAGLEQRCNDHDNGEGLSKGLQAAAEFVALRYGGSLCSFIAGSYAVGDATAYSDVDIFVLDDRFMNPAREQAMFKSYPIQIGAMSTGYAIGLIETCRRKGSLSFVPAFAVGRKLSGRDDVFNVVNRAAREALAEGPLQVGEARLRRSRAAVINNYLKVARGSSDPVERFGACAKLIQSAAQYIQLSAGSWASNEVKYEPALRASDEYRRLIDHAPEAFQGEVKRLLDAIYAILSARDEFLWGTEDAGLLPWTN